MFTTSILDIWLTIVPQPAAFFEFSRCISLSLHQKYAFNYNTLIGYKLK